MADYTYTQSYAFGSIYTGDAFTVTNQDDEEVATGIVDTGGTGVIELTVPDDSISVLTFTRDSDERVLATVVFDPREIASLNTSEGGDLSALALQATSLAIKAKTDLISAGAITVSSPVTQTGNRITAKRGDSWSIPLDGLGDLSSVTKLWFAVKRNQSDSDADALLFIELADTGDATIEIDDDAAGDIRVLVDETVTAEIAAGSAFYTLKKLDGGDAATLVSGRFTIEKEGIEAIA